MIYILIVAMFGFNAKGVAVDHIEFLDLKSCQAAAAEWKFQYQAADSRNGVVFCAAKGEKK